MKRTKAILALLVILVLMLLPNISSAASGNALVKISTDTTSAVVGDTVKITVSQYTIGTSELKNSKYVEFKLTYDKNIFSYQGITDGFDAEGAETGIITVKTQQPHESENISSVVLTFKAIKATTRNEGNFKVTEFKSGENSGNTEQGSYSVMQLTVKVREKYEGTISIQADKTSIPVQRKVNISLAQTIPTNYVEATISYDKDHFEFVAPANSEYTTDTSTEGQVTVKASGTDIADVTLLFKGIAETEERNSGTFKILSYNAGNSAEEASDAHLFYSQQVSVAVTPRNNSAVQISTNLTDNIAKLGETFVVTVSQDKPTDYLRFDLFYDQEVFGYVGLGDNNAEINAIQEDGMLSISATGSQISEINLRFQALELTEGRNEENKEYIKLNNFLSGDNEGDTDIASNDMQQVGIQVIEAPVEELPIDELPATGSVVDTLIATNIAGIALLAVVLKKYVNN